jgi:MFS family permease
MRREKDNRTVNRRTGKWVRFLWGLGGLLVGAYLAAGISLFLLIWTEDDFGTEMTVMSCFAPLLLLLGIIGGAAVALRLQQNLLNARAMGASRWHSIRVVISILLAIVPTVVALNYIANEHVRMPTDRELLANFEHHNKEFAQLATMASQDKKLEGVSQGHTIPADLASAGIFPARLQDYNRLLAATGVPVGFHTTMNPNGYQFRAWEVSGFMASTSKGYMYCETPPDHIQSSLDDGIRSSGSLDNVAEAHRHITGKWYLFYHDDPD